MDCSCSESSQEEKRRNAILTKIRLEVTRTIALQFKEQSDDFRVQLEQLQKSVHAVNADLSDMQKLSPQAKLSCHSCRKDDHNLTAEVKDCSDHVATRLAEQDEKMQALRTAAKSMTLSTGPHESLDGDHIDNSQQHGKYSNSAVAVLLRFDDDFQLLKDRMVKVEERMEAVVTITVMEAAVRGLGLCVMEGAVRIKDIQERLTAFEDLSMAAMREEHDAVKIEHEDQHSLHKAGADVTEKESNRTVHRLGKIMQADSIFKMRPRLKTPRGKAATSSGVAVA